MLLAYGAGPDARLNALSGALRIEEAVTRKGRNAVEEALCLGGLRRSATRVGLSRRGLGGTIEGRRNG